MVCGHYELYTNTFKLPCAFYTIAVQFDQTNTLLVVKQYGFHLFMCMCVYGNVVVVCDCEARRIICVKYAHMNAAIIERIFYGE